MATDPFRPGFIFLEEMIERSHQKAQGSVLGNKISGSWKRRAEIAQAASSFSAQTANKSSPVHRLKAVPIHDDAGSVKTSDRSTASATPKARSVRPRDGLLRSDVGSRTSRGSASRRSSPAAYEPARYAPDRSRWRARSATAQLPWHILD